VTVIAGRPQQTVHGGRDDCQPLAGLFYPHTHTRTRTHTHTHTHILTRTYLLRQNVHVMPDFSVVCLILSIVVFLRSVTCCRTTLTLHILIIQFFHFMKRSLCLVHLSVHHCSRSSLTFWVIVATLPSISVADDAISCCLAVAISAQQLVHTSQVSLSQMTTASPKCNCQATSNCLFIHQPHLFMAKQHYSELRNNHYA